MFQGQWSKVVNETEGTELTERQGYWLEQIKACESEGKSLSSYAAEQGFHFGSIYAAKKTLIGKGVLAPVSGVGFHRVPTAAVNANNKWCLQFPNGMSVEFSGPADTGSLSTVLTTVAGLE
jgi:hypothetical protein